MDQNSHLTLPPVENLDLVVLARTSRRAFGELYDLYYPQIFRHCLRRLFRREAAEDVTAEVFLSVARRIREFPGRTHNDFIRWTHAIATNQINAYLRKHERRTRLLEEAARRGAVHAAGQSSAQVDLALLDWSSVYQSLLKLGPRDQSIIVLRYFEEMPHEMIAGILEMQPGAVRTAASRALNRMRLDLGINHE